MPAAAAPVRARAATPPVVESHACPCDGVTARMHACILFRLGRRARRPERRARSPRVRVRRAGRCPSRPRARGPPGTTRVPSWGPRGPGAARRPARQGGLPVHPCARGAGRAPTGAARRIARISGRDAPACPPLRPSIFSAIDRSLSSGHGPGLGGWLTDSASPAVVRGREARGHALIKAELPGVSRARGRAPESCCAPPPH